MASHAQVSYGSSGSTVRTMQNYLLRLGYSLSPYGADGIFGSVTRRAVIAFQKNHGLVQDGICGPKTWAALDAAIARLSSGKTDSSDSSESTSSTLERVTDETGAPAMTGESGAAYRTEVQLLINNADVTDDVQRRIVSATFTDNEDGSADDFQIVLEDSDNRVVREWLSKELEERPEEHQNESGTVTLVPLLLQINPNGDGRNLALACGSFELDEVDMKGPPQQVTMKGTSLAYTGGMRDKKRYVAWENITLLNIAKRIAKNGAYSVMYLTDKTVRYTRKEQNGKTDAAFLQELCEAAGLAFKVTDGTLVIFDKREYESKTAVRTITRGDGSYSSYSFSMELANRYYVACKLTYKDDKGTEYEGWYIPEGSEYTTTYIYRGCSGQAVRTLQKYLIKLGYSLGGNEPDGKFGYYTQQAVKQFQSDHDIGVDGECGKVTWPEIWDAADAILEVTNEPVSSNEEARKRAEYRLRTENKGERSASFTMPGDLTLCAGLTVEVAGFGDYDGKYIIEQGKHTVSRSSGYRMTVNLREVIESY